MKIVAIIARILLGLTFLVFGLNGFLNFMHAPLPPGLGWNLSHYTRGQSLCLFRFWRAGDRRRAPARQPVRTIGAGIVGARPL